MSVTTVCSPGKAVQYAAPKDSSLCPFIRGRASRLRLPKLPRAFIVRAADVVKTEESEAFTTSDGVIESVEDEESQVLHAQPQLVSFAEQTEFEGERSVAGRLSGREHYRQLAIRAPSNY